MSHLSAQIKFECIIFAVLVNITIWIASMITSVQLNFKWFQAVRLKLSKGCIHNRQLWQHPLNVLWQLWGNGDWRFCLNKTLRHGASKYNLCCVLLRGNYIPSNSTWDLIKANCFSLKFIRYGHASIMKNEIHNLYKWKYKKCVDFAFFRRKKLHFFLFQIEKEILFTYLKEHILIIIVALHSRISVYISPTF